MTNEQAVSLLKEFIKIRSVTGLEAPMADAVEHECRTRGFKTERLLVEPGRENVFAYRGTPEIVFTTHIDVVPGPDSLFHPCEDGERIIGRGAVDTKGITVSMLGAIDILLDREFSDIGLLFVVGEEINGCGAKLAARELQGRGIKYLINGEPTEHCLGIAHKGAITVRLEAHGKACHSGYPELGEDATLKLVAAIQKLREADLGHDADLGNTTLNFGVIGGGLAPNVLSPLAWAEGCARLVTSEEEFTRRVTEAVGELATVILSYEGPVTRMLTVPILPSVTVSYFSDVPHFVPLGAKTLMYGPGSIHRAHTDFEYITRGEIARATEDFVNIADYLRKHNP